MAGISAINQLNMRLAFWKTSESDSDVFGDNFHGGDVKGSWFDRPIFGEGSNDPIPDNWYMRVSRWALGSLVFLVPIFFLPWTTNVLDSNKEIILIGLGGVACIGWLLGVVSSGWLGWRSNPFEKVLLAMLVVGVAATITAVSPFRALFGTSVSLAESLVVSVGCFVVFILMAQVLEGRGSVIRNLLAGSLIAAFVLSIIQLLGFDMFQLPFSANKSFNTVGTLNALGILAASMLPFFGMYRPAGGWFKILNLDKIGVGLCLIVLLVVNWEVLWIIAILGMVSLIAFESMVGERFKLSKLRYPMTLVVIGVFLILIDINPIQITGLPVEVGLTHSLSWDVAKEALTARPLIGYGPENFSLAFDRYGASKISNSQLGSTKFYDASSGFLNYVIQGGILAVLATVFFLVAMGWSIGKFKHYLAQVENHEIRREDMGLLAAFVALTVAWFLYPFQFTLTFVWYVLLSLVTVTIWGSNRRYYNIEEKTSLSLVSSLGFIGGLILVLVGAYFTGTFYVADVKYAKALVEPDRQAAAGLIVEAINLNNQDGRFYRSASQTAINLLSQEISQGGGQSAERTARIQNYTSSAVTLARRATEVEPEESQNWANLGNVYQNLLTLVEGADRLAEEAHLKAAELRPGDASFYNQIGQVYLAEYEVLRRIAANRGADVNRLAAQADVALKKAEENFKKAIEISENFGTAIYSLGAIYDRQGRVNEAIRELERVLPANRNQPGLRFELGLLYYRAGNKAKAFEQLQQAVVLAPDYSNARWYMALLLEEQGDLAGAIDQLERIQSVEVNRDNQAVIQKLEQLRTGTRAIPPGNVLDQRPIN